MFFYKNIAKDVETSFAISNELERKLTEGKSKKVICGMKDELGGKIQKKMLDLQKKDIVT